MLNLVSLSTQSLASCVNYFVWNCFTCFSNTKIGSVTSFRYCSIFKVLCASALRLTTLLFYHRSGFLSSFIFSRLLNVLNLDASKFLGADRNFSASIGSFQRLRAEASEVILLSQRLALTYSTTFKRVWQAFFQSFLRFFRICIQEPVFCSKLPGFRAGLPILSYYKRAAVQAPCTAAPRVQLFSSCFICRRVSQTATASTGSMPIRPMGIGPNTV